MRVLVTGAAGFIASHLVRRLVADGHAVWAVDRRELPPLPGATARQVDLLDRDATRAVLAECRPDAVAHLAARTDLAETRDIAGYRDNSDAVTSLLDAIEGVGGVGRLVCTSSQLVCRVGYRPAHDEDYQPDTLYGQSKVLTEQITRARDGAGTSWCLVRPTTIWGPGMNPHYLRFFAMIRDGRYRHVGAGPTYKHYGYVGNTIVQFARLLEAPAAQVHRKVFYAADYTPLALEEWANGFQRALGAPPIRTIPRWMAEGAARAGDLLASTVWPSFPFTTFRLRNVLTAYQAELGPTEAVVGPLPFDVAAGITATTAWLRTVWASAPGARVPGLELVVPQPG